MSATTHALRLPALEHLRGRSSWLPVAAALGALLALYGLWQVLRWPHGHRELVGDVAFYPFDLAAACGAWLAAKRCATQPRLRSAWRLLALGLGANFLGDFIWTVYELVGSKPYPSLADVFYLLFYPLVLWGLLRFPAYRLTPGERIRRGLDLAVVAIGGIVVVVYVYLGPRIVQGGPGVLEPAVSIAYPVGDAVLLVGLASVVLRGRPPSSARALGLLAGGLLFFVAADLIYGYITLHGTYEGGNPNDTLYLTSMALFAIAATTQSSPGGESPSFESERRPRAGWTPYLAVAIAFGVLVAINRHDRPLPDLTILLAALLLVVLVSLRQFLAQRDLVGAQRRIVHQSLHDALTGLPNRALVRDRAEQMLARARRSFRVATSSSCCSRAPRLRPAPSWSPSGSLRSSPGRSSWRGASAGRLRSPRASGSRSATG